VNFKHFIKILLIFIGMIFLGLLGVYLLNYFDKGNSGIPNAQTIAK